MIRTEYRIRFLGRIFLGAFCFVVLFLLYFNFIESRSITANSFNKRLRQEDGKTIRGTILDHKGNPLVRSYLASGDIVRTYQYGKSFAHIIGYSDNNIGSSGIEALYNKELMSPTGIIETVQQQIFQSYVRGENVRLTLDKNLQIYAEKLLNGRKGAIVAIEPSTGRLLAVVSKPDFNPNTIAKTWKSLKANNNSPLMNRAFEGLYPPGSIFKVVTTSALLENQLDDLTVNCTGTSDVDGLKINDHNSTRHGKMNLKNGFAKSCNSYFIKAGLELGSDTLTKEANSWAFNESIMNFYNYKTSTFATPDNKRSLALTAFGQGKTLITPLHAAMIAAAVANEGVMMKPMLVESFEDEKGNILKTFNSSKYRTVASKDITDQLTVLMRRVVTSGTGTRAGVGGIKAAGKTGSAENSTGNSHAWFIGFAPYNNPKIAIAVIIENGGTGGENSAPIAGKIMSKYLKSK